MNTENRETYSNISETHSHGIESQRLPEQTRELRLEFYGSAREYFRIWIVNLCLTLLTIGIFSAWAKVRKKRYFYSHTILDGTPFQYLGQPIPILKGRVFAGIVFLIYYISSHFFLSLLPYILVVGIILAPWAITKSAAFNARYSAFRNMTFKFDGKYLGALKTIYAWGLVPVFVVGTTFNRWENHIIAIITGIMLLVFGILFPWWIRRLKNFIISHTSYGGKNGVFSATGGQFFKIYFISGLIIVAFVICTAILVAILSSSIKKSPFPFVLPIILMYAGYALAFAYVQAHSSNLVWNYTLLGPLRFQSTLLGRGMTKLYITNALAIIISLGLLIPWAVMRTLKYRIDHLRVLQEGYLTEFQGNDPSTVQAAGAETVDFFDMDISL